MTLDEAIQRENESAEANQKIVDTEIVFDDVYISQLYCDDTEVIEEQLSNYRKYAEYHKQIAEWLEDYKRIKMLISIEQTLKAEYNKAIDDFAKALTTMYERYDIDDVFESSDTYSYTSACYIFEHYIDEIAEQLKTGGNINE